MPQWLYLMTNRGWGSTIPTSVVSRYVKRRIRMSNIRHALSRIASRDLVNRTSNDLGFTGGGRISGPTLPELGEPDVGLRWYILGVSIAGGVPRLPGATATLVIVISRDGRRPQCLRSTSSPRPSVPRASSGRGESVTGSKKIVSFKWADNHLNAVASLNVKIMRTGF